MARDLMAEIKRLEQDVQAAKAEAERLRKERDACKQRNQELETRLHGLSRVVRDTLGGD